MFQAGKMSGKVAETQTVRATGAAAEGLHSGNSLESALLKIGCSQMTDNCGKYVRCPFSTVYQLQV